MNERKNTGLYWQFVGLGYLWLVRLEVSSFSSLRIFVLMSLWEGSILVSSGRWFCCYCLVWSPLLSTHRLGPRRKKKKNQKTKLGCQLKVKHHYITLVIFQQEKMHQKKRNLRSNIHWNIQNNIRKVKLIHPS